MSTMNNRTPRVTVCIPTIDRPHFLREAIASVVAQTFDDFEIVIADNSGDVKLQNKIDAVLAEFPGLGFTLVRHPRQIHAADNFNSLIDAARGEMWTCLPDDDRFCPAFLERSVGALDQHADCAFTFSDHSVIDGHGVVSEPQSLAVSAQFGRSLLREGIYRHHQLFEIVMRQSLCLQAALFRRPVISLLKFVPGILALDQSLFLRLSTGQNSFDGYYLDQRLMEYRLHSEQISQTTPSSEFLRSTIDAMESVTNVPRRHVRQFNSKLSRIYLALALAEAEQGSGTIARTHALRSLRLSPGPVSALGALLTIAAPRAISPMRHVVRRIRNSARASN